MCNKGMRKLCGRRRKCQLCVFVFVVAFDLFRILPNILLDLLNP